jgi:hypothetical protein
MRTYTIKKVVIPIYNAKILYCEYNEDYFDELLLKLRRNYRLDVGEIKDDGGCKGLCLAHTHTEPTFFLVFINISKVNKSSKYINVMTHEIRHLVDDMCDHFQIPYPKGKANEPVTYLTGYINEVLLNKKRLK